MHFLTSAILALSCIVAVSSQPRDQSTAFNEYEDLYRDGLVNDVPKMTEFTRNKITETIRSEKTAHPNLDESILEELVVESAFVQRFIENHTGDLKINSWIFLFYFRYLAGHYLWFVAESAKKFRKQAESSGTEEDVKFANNLDLMKSILEIYATKHPVQNPINKIMERYTLGEEVDDPDDLFRGTVPVIDSVVLADYQTRKNTVKRAAQGLVALFGLSSAPLGKLSSIRRELMAIKTVFEEILPGCFTPNSQADSIPDEKKDEVKKAIADLGLLDPRPFTCLGQRYSRVVKIVQVLMIGDGFNLIQLLLDWAGIQSEAGPSGTHTEAGTSGTPTAADPSGTPTEAGASESK